MRVYSGDVKLGQIVYNPLKKKKERINKIVQMHANKRTEIPLAKAGDIVAFLGLKFTTTGETLCTDHKPIIFDLMEFPEAVISVAIEAKTAADEKKLLTTLAQLVIEDPSFSYRNNKETGQLLIYGMGELHLEIIADRLLREFKVGVNIGSPQVSYRESISGVATEGGIYEEEFGGKLQFGAVEIKVEPAENQAGVVFETEIKKRDLPLEFISAVEKSIHDTAPGGAMAGYPFINIKATLLTAQYNEESSTELAYSIITSSVFKKACEKAGTILLEPFMSLEVLTPTDYAGDVISDINMKRGKVVSMDTKNQKDVIKAEVPLAELFGYSTDLRSKTQGRANFAMTFLKYEKMPRALAKQVLEKKGIFI